MKARHSDLLVRKEETILNVLKRMDNTGRKLLLVMDGDRFESVISIGDIQRAIIKGVDIVSAISGILRAEVCFALSTDDLTVVRERMKNRRNELMPIVSHSGELVDIIFWEDLFGEKHVLTPEARLNLPVVIMAGGQGTRLKPLTNVLPKPLIPINSKTIIEGIMDRFNACGCNEFYISINYKAELIRYYLDSLENKSYNICYFQEEKPLGTGGSLHLLKDRITSTFFVSNCDIIIDQDYTEIFRYHVENRNEITVVAAIKNYSIPYGTLTTREDGLLLDIEEKPEFVFKINTGFYILEPNLLNEIPCNEFYHITSLIEKLQKEGRRVGVFPVSEGSWIDIGTWSEYFSHIRVNYGS